MSAVRRQGALTSDERASQNAINALRGWARTVDRRARTAPARRALREKFERQVPAEITDPNERASRAEQLRSAHYRELALKSAKSRRRAKELLDEAAAFEAELSSSPTTAS